jgi:inosose dehydratase
MAIRLGNAPCSWGVEFADDPRNPPWRRVLRECAEAGYSGIELGPIGFMPEDPKMLADALAGWDLTLIGGVLFRPFHDPAQWDGVLDAARRTCRALAAHGARHLVLIDSIAVRRAVTAGRAEEAAQMDMADWTAFRDRLATVARMGSEEYGLVASIHPHAGGFIDFEPEIERLLNEVDESILKLCVDTGHHAYAGFDPVAFIRGHIGRISYVHLKDIDPAVKARVIAERVGFYEACGQRIFCNLGLGEVNFAAVRQALHDAGFEGWCTVEQDCDPRLEVRPVDDARRNRTFLQSISFA